MNIKAVTTGAMIGLLAFGGSLAAGGALADPAIEPVRSITVAYGDLDLSKEADAARLYRRITSAAHAACGALDTRSIKRWKRVRDCREQAIARAVEQVNVPVLTALHRSRSVASAG